MALPLPLNCILSFCKEKIAGHGEDSYCHAFCEDAGLLAVFDGCGGAGAQTHDCYSGHSEAYIASRLCAGAVYDSFREAFPGDLSPEVFARERLTQNLQKVLECYDPEEEDGQFRIRGSLIRTLPTTAAMALVRPEEKDRLQVSAIWAGDSRVYILDSDGLAQLTSDDTTVPDPMENLYEDGILRNLVCKDRPVRLHCVTCSVKLPCVVFAATDGCFGYVSTPMEFEDLLLSTLQQSDYPDQWEQKLSERIGSIAGDDHTLCLGAFGYGSFESLRDEWKDRSSRLREEYLLPLEGTKDRQLRRQLWEVYASEYCRYLKDGK